MKNEKSRRGFMAVVLALLGMVVLGGCTPADSTTVEVFVAEFLRGAAAALVL